MSAEALNDLDNVILWIDTNTSNLEIPSDAKVDLALACFDIALEHQAAVSILYKNGLYGSMLSLLKVLTESVVRGMWILHCASEREIRNFLKNRDQKTFKEMIGDIESFLKPDIPTLSNLHKNLWKDLNGFTHTGFNHLSNRFDDNNIKANYNPQDLTNSLALSITLGLIAASEFIVLSEKEFLLPDLRALIASYGEKKYP